MIYRRTQSGEGAAKEDICIVLWDDHWLEEEIEIPIQWENHRRHYFERLEEEESEGEEEDPRKINFLLSDLYGADKEEDNNNEGEDVDGEEGEEEEEEEVDKDTIEGGDKENDQEVYEEEEDSKENGRIN